MTIHIVVRWAFPVLWAAWVIYWFVRARGNKPTAHRLNLIWRWATFILLVALWSVMRLFPEYFDRRLLPFSWTRTYFSLLLTFLGLAFTVWARRALGANWSANPTIKVGHELIQTGPYRWVRHPIYTGLLLAIFASFLSEAKVSQACIFVCLAVLLIVKLRIEEGLMLRQFPDAYPEYRRRTNALVPFLF